MNVNSQVEEKSVCYHCGLPCPEEYWSVDDKKFCCTGCQTVYQILNENNLCEYYTLDRNPGIRQQEASMDTYAFLDEKEIRRKLMEFDSDALGRIEWQIPSIHCASCIWLLENLRSLQPGILKSEVNFSRKTVRMDFAPREVALSSIARTLSSLGYAPQIHLAAASKKDGPSNRGLLIKLAVAGFCFGNIMLLSFPEYLGLDDTDTTLRHLFSLLNICLALPVVVYSGQDYFIAAWKSFRQRAINIDVPIAVGLAALLLRSVYDILTQMGPGYLDSLTGLVFFLLIGRWFQNKTYESLAFDRDYRSYFPLAVHKLEKQDWKPALVYDLVTGDRIRVRNMEIIPADSILLDSKTYVDYSFVTGESRPVPVLPGELIFAGGRLLGQQAEMTVEKRISQSYLTSLWNNEAFRKPRESHYKKIIDLAARRFTWVVLVLALAAAIYWYLVDPSRMWLILTSVLMVACPCALALAAPFTFGNALRVLGKHGLYLKNADVVERLAGIDRVIFDKTGTVTHGSADVVFTGDLKRDEWGWVKSLAASSLHPLSVMIAKSIPGQSAMALDQFEEYPGRGLACRIGTSNIRMGSASFVGLEAAPDIKSSRVYVSIDGFNRGVFAIGTSVRKEIPGLVKRLNGRCAALLSGDNDSDRSRMAGIFLPYSRILFDQSPHDKLAFVRQLQQERHQVMMLGDGLNDSGALKQSDVGIAVADDTSVFTPACDGILKGDQLGLLDKFLDLGKGSLSILKMSFVLSFLYNAIGLSFAMSGHLTPLIAAVLMPVSSISVVGFTTLAMSVLEKKLLTRRL